MRIESLARLFALASFPILITSLSGQEIKIAVEANNVAAAVAIDPDRPFGPLNAPTAQIPGLQDTLSYLAFDLNTLPQGATIVDVELGVFDWSYDVDAVGEMYLLDVPSDFDAETFTYTMAQNHYGALAPVNDPENPGELIAGVDQNLVLWFGTAMLDHDGVIAPGAASVGTRRVFSSAGTFQEIDLVDALNAALNEGDGLVTIVFRGTTPYPDDNFLLGINFPDSENGPTLEITMTIGGGSGPSLCYDFDDNTLQEWTNLTTSDIPNGPNTLNVLQENSDPLGGGSVTPLASSSPYFVGPDPFEEADGNNSRDDAHKSLVLRSPEFRVYPNGSLSFSLIGGSHPGTLDAVNNLSEFSTSDGSGVIGVGLRRVSDDQYIGFYARSENGSQFWETQTLSGDDLAALVSGDQTYTLDFIDSHHGSWGWAGLDDVVIHEGTPVLSYDFDDHTLQGWTNLTTSDIPSGPNTLNVLRENSDPLGGGSVTPLASSSPYFVGPDPFEHADGNNARDNAHVTLVLRSPEFSIYQNGSISFSLIGGSHDGTLSDVNNLPENSTSDGSGVIGVGLRRVSDDQYIGFYPRTENGSQFWETQTLSGDQLASMVSDDETYTLDFIDSHHGSWGWAGLDDVVINKGSPGASYDFDDNSLQGWTNLVTSDIPNGPTQMRVLEENSDPLGGGSVTPLANSAPYFVGPDPFEQADGNNSRDGAHKTLIVRSPEFSLYPNGSITFALIGGSHPGTLAEANNLSEDSTSDGSGLIGFGLRRVSDGQYVGFYARSENGSQFWEVTTLDCSDFRRIVSASGETYTLDFIDSHHGGWGWAGFDDVIINEGTPVNLVDPNVPENSISVDENGNVLVRFEGTLQVSDSPAGPWSDLPGATSPYNLSAGGAESRFARSADE